MTARSIVAGLSVALLCAACSAEQPAAAPRPVPIPIVAAAPEPVKEQPDPLMQDWNIFPDPTSGKVEVYHDGAYVGAVTGDEPTGEDPPLPHKTGGE